jgi:hypothetical protein
MAAPRDTLSACDPGMAGWPGTLTVTRHYPEEPSKVGWITIDHADPRILISHHLLERIGRGECEPYARLDGACDTHCWPGYQAPCYQGARLEIAASNGRLVYVIGEPDFASWSWTAEWPD